MRALKSELKIESIELSDLFFLYEGMNLASPENEIRGKLAVSFQKLRGSDPKAINALWRLVLDTVKSKACFEYTESEYKNIVANKGLTRAEFDEILDTYDLCAKTGISEAEAYISGIDNVGRQRALRKALSRVLQALAVDRSLKEVVAKVVSYLNQSDISADFDVVSNSVVENCMVDMPKDYTAEEKKMMAVVMVNRFAQGGYDDADVV